MEKELIVAAYCRVGNVNHQALEEQKEYLKKYADEQGYTNLVFYVDNGYRGTNYERPSFLKLKADIEAGHVKAVFVKSIDRVGRRIFDTARWIEWVRKNGVKLYTANTSFEEIPIDKLGYYKRGEIEKIKSFLGDIHIQGNKNIPL